MIKIVADFLNKYNIKNKTVIIGFSAGPDSCALARIINELKKDFNLKIVLAYFNHMWREEAELEEKFTKDFASLYGNDYTIGKAPSDIARNEETAREYRYNFFYETAKKYNSDTIFLAHNKNDNIETLIYRIIKGTSSKGLCSIPEKRDIFYRPLLKIEKKDLINYLKESKQEYLTDSSNSDTKYKRNFIRQKILPLFKEINPNYVNNLDNLITTSIQVSKIVKNVISEIKNNIIKDDIIDRNKYLSYGIEYRYEILNSYVGDKLKYRDFKTIKKLDDFIEQNPHSKTSLNSFEFLRTRRNKIFIERKSEGNKNEPA